VSRAALTLALALAAACGGDKRAAPPPPAPPPDAAMAVGPVVHDLGVRPPALDEPHPPMPSEVRATVLAPGAAPRAVRRYALADGPERTLTVRAEVTIHRFRLGAWTGPTALPAVTDGFAYRVTPTAAGATLALRGLPGAIAADAAATAAATDELTARWRALLERRRITAAIDPSGRITDVRFDDDPGAARPDVELATDELYQRLLAQVVPWPREPIGVGARWRVITLLRIGGAYVKQTATYELTALDGARATIAVALTRLAERQLLALPGLPAGAEAELIGLVREQTGTVTVDLAAPLPLAGRFETTLSSHAQFRAGAAPALDEVADDRAVLTLTGG